MTPPAGRGTFVHDAVLDLDPDGDERAPGGAITVALCGSWSHDPPCPLAPHATRVERSGTRLQVRVLFATAPADEARVRGLIDHALSRGSGEDPEGARTSWRLLSSAASQVRPEEAAHAERLTRS
jgi:hypothetical protein